MTAAERRPVERLAERRALTAACAEVLQARWLERALRDMAADETVRAYAAWETGREEAARAREAAAWACRTDGEAAAGRARAAVERIRGLGRGGRP